MEPDPLTSRRFPVERNRREPEESTAETVDQTTTAEPAEPTAPA